MKQQSDSQHKSLILLALFSMSVLITLSGLVFGIYAFLNGTTFRVLNVDVPGVVFGMLVIYLGARYFLSVRKLRSEIDQPDAVFSWSNFKKRKTAKSR